MNDFLFCFSVSARRGSVSPRTARSAWRTGGCVRGRMHSDACTCVTTLPRCVCVGGCVRGRMHRDACMCVTTLPRWACADVYFLRKKNFNVYLKKKKIYDENPYLHMLTFILSWVFSPFYLWVFIIIIFSLHFPELFSFFCCRFPPDSWSSSRWTRKPSRMSWSTSRNSRTSSNCPVDRCKY